MGCPTTGPPACLARVRCRMWKGSRLDASSDWGYARHSSPRVRRGASRLAQMAWLPIVPDQIEALRRPGDLCRCLPAMSGGRPPLQPHSRARRGRCSSHDQAWHRVDSKQPRGGGHASVSAGHCARAEQRGGAHPDLKIVGAHSAAWKWMSTRSPKWFDRLPELRGRYRGPDRRPHDAAPMMPAQTTGEGAWRRSRSRSTAKSAAARWNLGRFGYLPA